MKNKKYHTVGTVLKLRRKIVERGKIDIHDTQIYKGNNKITELRTILQRESQSS